MVMARREDAAVVTEAIIAHPAIRKVEFIGSAPIGRQIGITAAKYLKPILMELGGKCPFIVLKDANLQKAVQFAAFGAFLHHGQVSTHQNSLGPCSLVSTGLVTLVPGL